MRTVRVEYEIKRTEDTTLKLSTEVIVADDGDLHAAGKEAHAVLYEVAGGVDDANAEED